VISVGDFGRSLFSMSLFSVGFFLFGFGRHERQRILFAARESLRIWNRTDRSSNPAEKWFGTCTRAPADLPKHKNN